LKTDFFKIFLLSFLFILSSCTTHTPHQNEALGTTVGAAAGAALGANSGPSPGPITLIGTGAIVGALIGFSYGNYMENSDKQKALAAIASGKPASWKNPETHVAFTVVPDPHCVKVDGNPLCRRFVATQTTTDGAERKIIKTACQGRGGDWLLVEPKPVSVPHLPSP
jgi:surface antigen